MLTTADFFVQSDPEREVRAALAKYKLGLIHTYYRNWMHRVSCWVGDKEALRWEAARAKADADARVAVNRSEEHKRWVRSISSQQPEYQREKDNFLMLLD